jgi:hypothetical protein
MPGAEQQFNIDNDFNFNFEHVRIDLDFQREHFGFALEFFLEREQQFERKLGQHGRFRQHGNDQFHHRNNDVVGKQHRFERLKWLKWFERIERQHGFADVPDRALQLQQ